jgi:hydrogenase-4 component F
MLPMVVTFLVPAAGAGLVFLARTRRTRLLVLLATTLAHVALTASLWGGKRAPEAGALFGVDAQGLLFLSVISLLYCLVAVHLVAYTSRDPRGAPPVFLACHLFSLAAMTVACFSQHWGLYWVAMEATTLASAPLLFYHHGPRSLEATWKYVLIGSVGIALALMGTFFLGMAAAAVPHVENSLVFRTMIANAGQLSVPWIKIAAVFLIVGYGTKMGLAPMHTWKPDAYGEAPPPVAALLSGGLTNCAFLGLLRVATLCNAAGEAAFVRSILVALGLVSVGIAAASMVGQANYRRMLAYSSVEHMGILTLAIGVGGLATFGGLLHALNNALNKGILFLAAGNILQACRTSEVKGVTGLFRALPVSAAFLVIGLFAATGFPPFGTFVSEFTILRGLIAGGGAVVPALYLGFLAVAFIGMGTIILSMVQGVPSAAPTDTRSGRDTLASILPMAILTALVLWLGLHIPEPLENLLREASDVPGGFR